MFTTISFKGKKSNRRAAVLVLAAILLVMMFAFLTFAIDLGYVTLTRTQLQNSADSLALAAASFIPNDTTKATAEAMKFAALEQVGGVTLDPGSVTVDFGIWNGNSRVFTAGQAGNAVRVTLKRDATHGGQIPLFFAPVLGQKGVDCSAKSVAMTNPRDICFVVDLSGSMNDDTEPCWTTDQINSTFSSTVGNTIMQNVFSDLNFGTFPGTLQSVGQPLGVSTYNNLVTQLTNNMSYSTTYRISSSDSSSTKKTKAYKWLIDYQLASIMPNALPTPNSGNAASLAYWTVYLDYVIYPQPTGASSSNAITGLGNPQTSSYPGATSAAVQAYRNQIGYRTYVQFMMDYGRDAQPPNAGQYTQLSYQSSYFQKKPDPTPIDGVGVMSFPPREMPTHAARRSIIAALQVIKERNANVSDSNERDWVSIMTFDKNTNASSYTPLHDLNWDYDQAMQDCTNMQAVGDNSSSTSTDSGLLAANRLLTTKGRLYTDKVVVLLTDGIPNLKDVNSTPPPSPLPPNWPSDANQKAAMSEIYMMQAKKWRVYPVGIGMGCNYTFMDCAAVTGGTANASGQSPRGTGDPSQYERTLKNIFQNIINNPKARIVQ
jgi:hypothetical protein